MNRLRRLRILFVLAATGFSSICNASDYPHDTYLVKLKSHPVEQIFDAVVEAVNSATLSSEISGQINTVMFDVDDYVEKGSILLTVSNRKERAKLSAAQAKELEAQANYNIALKEHKRLSDIFAKNLISKSELDKAEATLKASKERLSAAQAESKVAVTNLNYSVVRAPFSGVVVERHVEPGEMAKVGQALMTGLSLENLRVSALIPQSTIGKARGNNYVRVIFDEQHSQNIGAKHVRISPQAHPNSHNFKMRIDLEKAPANLYPGMSVKIAVTAGSRESLVIPKTSVLARSELRAVYVIDNKKVSLRQVRLGREYPNQQIEILAGLNNEEVIALNPIEAARYVEQSRLNKNADLQTEPEKPNNN